MPYANRNSRKLVATAARTEFAQHGYQGARIARIAARAGVNKQLLYYYFGSKAGLYEAVVQHACAQLTAAAAEPDPPDARPEAVRGRLGEVFRRLAEEQEIAALLLQGMAEGGAAGRTAAQAVRGLVSRIAGLVSHGQGIGYFRDDTDPERAARHGVALLFGYLALEAASSTNEPVTHSTNWADDAVGFLVQSLMW